MLGLNHVFDYFECGNCGCLQIIKIPENIADYYPTNYLSFNKPVFSKKLSKLRLLLKAKMSRHYNGASDKIGHLMSLFYNNPLPFIRPGFINLNSKILDIGCGTGKLLLTMQRNGYKNLEGIDLYIENDIKYDNGVSIYKNDIFKLTEKYDLIMLNHSFEHMDLPHEVLNKLSSNLNANGTIMIRIPVAGSYAWRKYKTQWVQLDAPRHYFLHTIKSICILADKCSYTLEEIFFESSLLQFTGSEKYLRGLDFNSTNSIFSKKQIKAFENKAKSLNAINDGDTACFYLRKND
jgi:2-polyprenyl-3-methyl-5-hydroxy-6-metoxy-1,4-benzoquinol methylase